MNKTNVRAEALAIRIPPLDSMEEEEGRQRIAVISARGEFLGVEAGGPGFETEALARLARRIGGARTCESELVAHGAASGWTAADPRIDVEWMRGIAAASVLLSGDIDTPFPIDVVDHLLDVSSALVASEPWSNPRIMKNAPTLVANLAGKGLPKGGVSGACKVSIQTLGEAGGPAFVGFEQRGGGRLMVTLEAPGITPAFVERFAEGYGLTSLPCLFEESVTGAPGPLSFDGFVTVLGMLEMLLLLKHRDGLVAHTATFGDRTIAVNTTIGGRTRPDGTPRLGRNEPCHCGSGKKYKKCHQTADEMMARYPGVRVQPLGGGHYDIAFPLPGKGSIPERGYYDCPICQAKTPAEKLRLMREMNGEKLN